MKNVIWIFVDIYVDTHNTQTQIHTHTHVWMAVSMYIFTCVYVYVYIHIRIFVYACIYIYIYILNSYNYSIFPSIYIYIYIYEEIQFNFIREIRFPCDGQPVRAFSWFMFISFSSVIFLQSTFSLCGSQLRGNDHWNDKQNNELYAFI